MAAITFYIKSKMKQGSTYLLTFVVGLLINLYGQLIVPLFRGHMNPIDQFLSEYAQFPVLVSISIVLGFLFPFCVTLFTAVLTRYQMRICESQALFPALKPDPVFRARKDGKIIAAGVHTQEVFDKHAITNTTQLIGKEAWKMVIEGYEDEIEVYVPSIGANFIIVYAHTEDGMINVYMTRRKKEMVG